MPRIQENKMPEFQEKYLPVTKRYIEQFRATRDLDMVLIVEALTPEFAVKFILV